ncbi:MAG: MgtC/SapB family protein [Myxococcota bacterium]
MRVALAIEAMETDLVLRLGVALALGLVIGVERGWQSRAEDSRVRSLGMRTFGLAGLLGAVIGSLAEGGGGWLLGLALVGLSGFAAVTYVLSARASGDHGATTELALLVTFALGALAASGREMEAAGAAVATALLLGSKTRLHRFVEALDEHELMAALQLLLVALVVLPMLPDRDFGPWGALNPRVLAELVLLVSGLSFAGYVSIKLLGARRGTLATAVFGGLTSSTAVTLAFARAAREAPESAALLGAGIGLAAATMALRLGLIACVVAPQLLRPLAPTLAVLAAVPIAAASAIALRTRARATGESIPLHNPLQLELALLWASLLALLSILSHALHEWLGAAGIYALAATSGLADVDAVSLSLARMVPQSLGAELAARAITCAALANTAAKAALAAFVGGPKLARSGGAILFATLCAGALAAVVAWQ